jgi:hypothetical protein
MNKQLIVIFCCILFIACKVDIKNIRTAVANKTEIKLNTNHSGEPNLHISNSGDLFISWVEYENDSVDVLKFSQLKNDTWTEGKEISRGENWFVNWADFPSIVSINDSMMTAHWLQTSASGTYDYDVRISQSNDKGNTWKPSTIPHRDGINAEHGFVTLLSSPEGKTFAVWLDGRNTKKETENAMTLRTATIDHDGNISDESELDNRVCDCCQTGATWTSRGPLVVYRDRSEEEIRDISYVKKTKKNWSKPKSLSNDNWKIAGCPVNGPSIDSKDSLVVVSWYTAANEDPKVYASLSRDYGETFSKHLRIDEGNAIGRVDIKIDDNRIIVSWMEDNKENEQDAEIKLKVIQPDFKTSKAYKVGANSSSRASGFPQLEIQNNNIIMAWTEVGDTSTLVKTYKIQIDE